MFSKEINKLSKSVQLNQSLLITDCFSLEIQCLDKKIVRKVQLFWEDQKHVHTCPYGFEIYLVNIKTMMLIAHIFPIF